MMSQYSRKSKIKAPFCTLFSSVNMVLNVEQRIDIVKWYTETNSFKTTAKLFKSKYRDTPPTRKTIWKINAKFLKEGTVLDLRKSGRPRSGRSNDNIVAVNGLIKDNPRKSVRRASSELNIPRSTVYRILRFDLEYFPYKIQIRQSLSNKDCDSRLDFARWMMDLINETPDVLNLIWFSDESHFHLNGHVNSQNCRYWGSENPHEVLERPLHPDKTTVWCAISSQGIIGPYFFEENGETVTVNGIRYRAMLQDFFLPELRRLVGRNIRNQWFQQDGATCHTANNTLSLLRDVFGDNLISLRTDKIWPPHSPDLNPPDYYLWGYLKDCVYRDPVPNDIEQLKTNIRNRINDIDHDTLAKVMDNFQMRMGTLLECNGRHIEHLCT